MGDYTALQFVAKIRIEAVPIIEALHTTYSWDEALQETKNEALLGWLKIDRRDFIPFGALGGFSDFRKMRSWDKNTRTWKVTCSLKDYGGEIEYFLTRVLPLLIEYTVTVTTRFEYDSEKTSTAVHPIPNVVEM